tara:strand:- start:1137 stop:2474 length:1338 start_codon:yes stop_codon:yes gene_type:complete
MIEFFNLFFQILFFVFLTYFPINMYLTNNTFRKISFAEILSINSLFFLSLLLILSFFKFNLLIVMYIITIIYILFFLNFLRNFTRDKKRINQFNLKKNYILKLFLFFLLICVFVDSAAQFGLEWDGFLWKKKVNFFYNGGYFYELSQTNEAVTGKINWNNYPHLGAYVWAFFWKNSFLNYEYIGRLFHDYIYVISLLAIVSTFRNLSDFKKIFLLFALYIITNNGNFSGYQDYLIFSILTIFASILLQSHFFKKKPTILYLTYLLAGIILPWIKTEGAVYSIFLIMVFFIYEYFLLKKNNNLKIYLIISLIIIFSIFFRVFTNYFILEESTILQTKYNFKDFDFLLILNRFYYIFFYLVKFSFKHPILLINLFLLIIAIFYFKKFEILKIFFTFFVLNYLFIFTVYLTTSADYIWHIQTSLNRIMLQTSGFYFVFFSLFWNKKVL